MTTAHGEELNEDEVKFLVLETPDEHVYELITYRELRVMQDKLEHTMYLQCMTCQDNRLRVRIEDEQGVSELARLIKEHELAI